MPSCLCRPSACRCPEYDPDLDCTVCDTYACEDHQRCETCKAWCADPVIVDGIPFCGPCDVTWKAIDAARDACGGVAAEGGRG
jgi:hypothetical protein